MPVDRCVCHDVTLSRLKVYAQQNRCGMEQLRAQFGCGSGCGLCVPYIRAMLRTGRTSFAVDDPDVRVEQADQRDQPDQQDQPDQR